MTNADLHEFKRRCLNAALLKHTIGVPEIYAAKICEELGQEVPEDLSPKALADLTDALLKVREGLGETKGLAINHPAVVAARASTKKPKDKKKEEAKAKPVAPAPPAPEAKAAEPEVKSEVKADPEPETKEEIDAEVKALASQWGVDEDISDFF